MIGKINAAAPARSPNSPHQRPTVTHPGSRSAPMGTSGPPNHPGISVWSRLSNNDQITEFSLSGTETICHHHRSGREPLVHSGPGHESRRGLHPTHIDTHSDADSDSDADPHADSDADLCTAASRGKRRSSQSKKATTYTVTFNESLNTGSANNLGLYQVLEGVTKHVKKQKMTVFSPKRYKIKSGPLQRQQSFGDDHPGQAVQGPGAGDRRERPERRKRRGDHHQLFGGSVESPRTLVRAGSSRHRCSILGLERLQ